MGAMDTGTMDTGTMDTETTGTLADTFQEAGIAPEVRAEGGRLDKVLATAKGSSWTIRQLKYQEWLGTPKALRPKNLKTNTAIAEALGITPYTLRNWRMLPGWWEAVYAFARSVLGEYVSDIMHAQAIEAIHGSTPAAKLCLELMGLFSEQVKHTVEIENDRLVIIMGPTQARELTQAAQLARPVPTGDGGNGHDTGDIIEGIITASVGASEDEIGRNDETGGPV